MVMSSMKKNLNTRRFIIVVFVCFLVDDDHLVAVIISSVMMSTMILYRVSCSTFVTCSCFFHICARPCNRFRFCLFFSVLIWLFGFSSTNCSMK